MNNNNIDNNIIKNNINLNNHQNTSNTSNLSSTSNISKKINNIISYSEIKKLFPLSDSIAGMIAGGIARICVAPFDLIKIRLQLQE